MRDLATAGGGRFVEAKDPQELRTEQSTRRRWRPPRGGGSRCSYPSRCSCSPVSACARTHARRGLAAASIALSAASVTAAAAIRGGGPSATSGLALALTSNETRTALTPSADQRRHAALGGGASIAGGGRFGQALKLTGAEEQGAWFGTILRSPKQVTFEVWASPVSGTKGVWSPPGTTRPAYWLGTADEPGTFAWFVDDVAATFDTGRDSTAWRHVAGTIDAASRRVALYVHGELVDTQSHPGPAADSESPLVIGTTPWAGVIYEVRIWSTARTPEQICADAGGGAEERGACRLT